MPPIKKTSAALKSQSPVPVMDWKLAVQILDSESLYHFVLGRDERLSPSNRMNLARRSRVQDGASSRLCASR